MAINVNPVPTLDAEINDIRMRTAEIVNSHILPNEQRLWAWRSDSANAPEIVRKEAGELRHEIQETVKSAGLWAPHLPEEYGGMGLSFLQHAYMNEVLALGEQWSREVKVLERRGRAELMIRPRPPPLLRRADANEDVDRATRELVLEVLEPV